MTTGSLWQDLSRNIDVDAAAVSGKRPSLAAVLTTMGTVRFLATVMFRLSQAAGRRSALLGSVLKQLNHLTTGADLAWQAEVGAGLVLFHPTGVVIGPHCRIGQNVSMQQGVTIGGDGGNSGGAGSSPTVGDGVRFGAGSRAFGAITIGADAVIGANAVVIGDVPRGAVAVGVPARLLDRSTRPNADAIEPA